MKSLDVKSLRAVLLNEIKLMGEEDKESQASLLAILAMRASYLEDDEYSEFIELARNNEKILAGHCLHKFIIHMVEPRLDKAMRIKIISAVFNAKEIEKPSLLASLAPHIKHVPKEYQSQVVDAIIETAVKKKEPEPLTSLNSYLKDMPQALWSKVVNATLDIPNETQWSQALRGLIQSVKCLNEKQSERLLQGVVALTNKEDQAYFVACLLSLYPPAAYRELDNFYALVNGSLPATGLAAIRHGEPKGGKPQRRLNAS